MPRSPLIDDGRFQTEVATDYLTGDTEEEVVWREGRWHLRSLWERRRRWFRQATLDYRRNRAVSHFLNRQTTDPGL